MTLWKITLSYDGTAFHGWQIQPDLPTVQGSLSHAIRHITGEAILPQGSGRTDAGVHALGQVASFPLSCPIPSTNLHRALNRLLPSSIRILSVESVDPPFHARHSAVQKTYEYRIFTSAMNPAADEAGANPPLEPGGARSGPALRICPPFLAPYVWDYRLPLDLASLNRAASHILGRHDFTSFAASEAEDSTGNPSERLPDYPATPPDSFRIVFVSAWAWSHGLLVYRVTGSGFLHHMVRNLVGTFVQVGAGSASADAIPAILAARSRTTAGPTAPARGLFLVDVVYP